MCIVAFPNKYPHRSSYSISRATFLFQGVIKLHTLKNSTYDAPMHNINIINRTIQYNRL